MRTKTAVFFSILIAFFSSAPAIARVSISNDASAQIEMDLLVEIPTNLSLRIGAPGSTIDTVRFNVTGLPASQPTVQGDYRPPIEVSSNLPSGSVLTADSTGGLRGPAADIPFTTISFEGTGSFSGMRGTFNGTANQRLDRIPGRGKRNGTIRFTYHNTSGYPPGTYTGTVTFTLSVP